MNKFDLKSEVFRLRIGVVLAAAIFCFALAACDSNRPEDPYLSVSESGIRVEDVMQDPGKYIGKQVTVAGRIEEMFGEQAFMIHGEKMVDGLLAVGADPLPEAQNEKSDYHLGPVKAVRVTGIVRQFDPAAVERETGVQLVGDTRLSRFTGKPVIIVKSLQKAEE